MSTRSADTGEEQDQSTDGETEEWVEENREHLERLADSERNSAWVAEKILQSDEEGDS